MTIIWLRNGDNFYVQEDYEHVTGRWTVRMAGKEEFRRCSRDGTFLGRCLVDLEQISNVFENLPHEQSGPPTGGILDTVRPFPLESDDNSLFPSPMAA